MPIKKAALKSIKKSKKKQIRNLKVKQELKNLEIKLKKQFLSKDYEQCKKAALDLISNLAKAASKKIIHRNKASRKTSRIFKKLSLLKKPKEKTDKSA